MILAKAGREFWTVNVDTTPDPAGVEAQFEPDGPWAAGQRVEGDTWRWLVRGPDAVDDPDRPSSLVPATTVPRLRIVDEPEIVIRRAYEAPIRVGL